MMRCKLLFFAFVLTAAGCTDDVDSITREYRATTNEAIDALMMVTNEAAAKRMTLRVLKPMAKRYGDIDKKLSNLRSNRDKAPFVKEVFESDGVQIYLTDLTVNRQRYSLEITRLRNLYAEIKAADETCPSLEDLVTKDTLLEPLRKHLKESELVAVMTKFPSWKVPNYDQMYAKFAERRATFVPQREIQLIKEK
jgi:hypothetical protein